MAENLNTTAIGDAFESRSLEIIKRLIEEEQIGHLKQHLKIFRKKGYFSHSRQKDITFDLTIEVWPPNAERYSLLYVIECKSYKGRVPVDEIETFHSQLVQLQAFNLKGIFISNSPLQEGGYNLAKSTGMMVIQGETADDYKIILHKSNKSSTKAKIPILNGTQNKDLIDAGVYLVEELVDKRILLGFKEIESNSHISYNIDRLSKKDIQEIAEEELNKIDPRILSDGYVVNYDKLIDYLRNGLNIEVEVISCQSEVLGFCNLQRQVIGINSSIRNSVREIFILAHELGHFVLHQKLKIGSTFYEYFEDPNFNFKSNRYVLNNPKNWVEWQANYFASSFILPEIPFRARLKWWQHRLNFTRGRIYLDDQYQNQKDFRLLVEKMAYTFNTSKTSIIFRLEEFDLINHQSRLKTIRQIFEEYGDELLV